MGPTTPIVSVEVDGESLVVRYRGTMLADMAPQVLVPLAVAPQVLEQDVARIFIARPRGQGDGHAADILQGRPVPLLARVYGHGKCNAQAYSQAAEFWTG
eukprot:5508629-Lingulodinium_polyedra.AAC.1